MERGSATGEVVNFYDAFVCIIYKTSLYAKLVYLKQIISLLFKISLLTYYSISWSAHR